MTSTTLPCYLRTAIAEANQTSLRARRRRGRLIVAWLVTASLLLVSALRLAWPYYRFTISPTASLPYSLFWVHVGQMPERGQMAALYVPRNRFYPPQMGFVKILRGVPGDVVSETDRHFAINGEYVGTAKSASKEGLPLNPGPVGVIPDGEFFFWTPHPDSFDSRYADIGWISARNILGVAHPIF